MALVSGIPVQSWLDLDDDRAIVTALEMVERAQQSTRPDAGPQMSG